MPPGKQHIWRLRRPCVESRDVRINLPVACNKSMRLIAGGSLDREAVSARPGLGIKAVGIIRAAMSQQGATAERGWESLPNAARLALVRSECYPTPTEDMWIMARLLADGATGPASAVRMPLDRGMRDLVRWGRVCRADGGGFYLVGLGLMLAQEVLSTYPEIGRPSFSRSGGERQRARELVGMVDPVAPPNVEPRRREARMQ